MADCGSDELEKNLLSSEETNPRDIGEKGSDTMFAGV
jgi:hypothetical protein